jgi:IclR-like helix-turn-helix domain-containing protein
VLTLHAIAGRTGLPKSLVFRLLRTLQRIGWVEKRDRTYRLLLQVPRRKRTRQGAPLSPPLRLPGPAPLPYNRDRPWMPAGASVRPAEP